MLTIDPAGARGVQPEARGQQCQSHKQIGFQEKRAGLPGLFAICSGWGLWGGDPGF